MFKIDLIVWKHNMSITELLEEAKFKIDLIVWKQEVHYFDSIEVYSLK